jgi:tRNA uridine 5-carboxymethylaminomethyl modification enzyme
VNAALRAREASERPLVLKRSEAYIGVMIDDLVTMGADEPYRLLTSRAEHRLLLGADTAYARLTPRAAALGLVSPEEADPILEREARLTRVKEAFEETRVRPSRDTVEALSSKGVELAEETTLAGLLRRPELAAGALREWIAGRLAGPSREDILALGEDAFHRVATELRYAGFLRREENAIRRVEKSAERPIPAGFEYRGLPGLSAEAAEKLERHRPRTLGQAGRIPGVTPAAVTLLLARLVSLERHGTKGEAA